MKTLLALYQHLTELCHREAQLIAAEDLVGLDKLLDEKDCVLQNIISEQARIQATGERDGLDQVLRAAEAAAAAEEVAARGLRFNLDALRQRLRQAGEGRAVVRSYRPDRYPTSRMDHYSA